MLLKKVFQPKEFKALLTAATLTMPDPNYFDVEFIEENDVCCRTTKLALKFTRNLSEKDLGYDSSEDYYYFDEDEIADDSLSNVCELLDECEIKYKKTSAVCKDCDVTHIVEKRTWDYPGANYLEVSGYIEVEVELDLNNLDENTCKKIAEYLQYYYK